MSNERIKGSIAMKYKILRAVLLIMLAALLLLVYMPFPENSEAKIFIIPGLPRPIAKAPVAITSAGQSTDTYIINEISNQLMIRSFFMPQAEAEDIEDMSTIVFSVGYSPLGIKFQGISYEDERARIEKLLDKAENDELTVITVVLGSEQDINDKNEEILKLIGAHTDYIIGLKGSGSEDILVELADKGNIPLTLVDRVNEISEPFASAFR
jgi:hypothetical protein